MKFELVTFDGVWLGSYRSRGAAERAMKTIQRNCAAINGRGARAPTRLPHDRETVIRESSDHGVSVPVELLPYGRQ